MLSQEGMSVYVKLMSAKFAASRSINNHATLLQPKKLCRKRLYVFITGHFALKMGQMTR